MSPRRRLLAIACLAVLPACGGGGDFGGDAKVPEGYKTFTGPGASFAYPADWQVEQRTDPDGAPFVEITPPDKAETPYGLIQLSVSPDAGERFQSLADQRRLVLRDVNDAKIDSDESVEVPGAEEALRARFTVPPGQGSDPVEVRTDSLDVLRSDGDVLVLTVAAPQRDGQGLDPGAVVTSFRLGD